VKTLAKILGYLFAAVASAIVIYYALLYTAVILVFLIARWLSAG
jgi:hypothetical protein